MRKMNIVLSAALCVAALAWAGSAAAFNPQPDPPGKHASTTNSSQLEPPDPCANSQTMMMNKNNSERTRPGQHKSMAMSCTRNGANSGVHKLNPQPLPPG